MAFKPTYLMHVYLKNGKYQVREGFSSENLKQKSKQFENEGANGHIERVADKQVVHRFGVQNDSNDA